MPFHHPAHRLAIPDGCSPPEAYARTTHLGIGAHQDDLEFMALHGILAALDKPDKWFGGVTCTDGGSIVGPGNPASSGIRADEQDEAARLGHYSFMAQLGHPSTTAKNAARRPPLVNDLRDILLASRPRHLYSHQPFDRHATHVGVFLALLEALRSLPASVRPASWHGCEVWRNLDWLPRQFKIIHDVSAHPELAHALNAVFQSQIGGGKRYDLAVEGRRRANATFLDHEKPDAAERCAYAIDLTAFLRDESLTVEHFAHTVLGEFQAEVMGQLEAVR